MRLAPTPFLTYLKQRLDSVRRVKGKSGNDGELLYQHFVDVFVGDGRENLLEVLDDDDARSPEYQMLAYLRTKEVIRELKSKYGLTGQLPTAPRKRRVFVARDPRGFESFLASRKIELAAMVS
jgi:hypothetical protein